MVSSALRRLPAHASCAKRRHRAFWVLRRAAFATASLRANVIRGIGALCVVGPPRADALASMLYSY